MWPGITWVNRALLLALVCALSFARCASAARPVYETPAIDSDTYNRIWNVQPEEQETGWARRSLMRAPGHGQYYDRPQPTQSGTAAKSPPGTTKGRSYAAAGGGVGGAGTGSGQAQKGVPFAPASGGGTGFGGGSGAVHSSMRMGKPAPPPYAEPPVNGGYSSRSRASSRYEANRFSSLDDSSDADGK